MNKFFLFIFFSSLSFSQTHTITGVVSDTLNNPLESANIIALPKSENAQLKFAIADNKEKYRLKLVFIILFKH
ncbi:MAG: hypothetical protein O9282_00765 [Flavobacterium sp.]|uniref:hypothetical protein n=1 Tax=Flavobacterium sp. TaxID=239 RepID=UPI0022C824EF|nr:hypothetical protein [Flavobacterium sp.]MCZ8329821.1 hypothetical protein [Flavobacterium sp.]